MWPGLAEKTKVFTPTNRPKLRSQAQNLLRNNVTEVMMKSIKASLFNQPRQYSSSEHSPVPAATHPLMGSEWNACGIIN